MRIIKRVFGSLLAALILLVSGVVAYGSTTKIVNVGYSSEGWSDLSGTFNVANGGYDGTTYWQYSSGTPNTPSTDGSWSAGSQSSTNTSYYVYIPSTEGTADVTYSIYPDGTSPYPIGLNQSNYSNQMVFLGEYTSSYPMILLTNYDPNQSGSVVDWDAAQFVIG